MIDAIEEALRRMRINESIGPPERIFENPDHIDKVQRAFSANLLTLVFGAGLSKSVNLPLWPELVESLYVGVYENYGAVPADAIVNNVRKLGYNDAILVRHLQSVLKFRSDVRTILQQRLYESFDESKVDGLIAPICECFLRGDAGSRVDEIITYNFDNIIERYLQRNGHAKFISIYSNESYAVHESGLKIYHPHGYIPHEENHPIEHFVDQSVVFSESDYHLHYFYT
jgi:hypothetical protein